LKERSLNLPMSLTSAAVKLEPELVDPALDEDLPLEPQPATSAAMARTGKK